MTMARSGRPAPKAIRPHFEAWAPFVALVLIEAALLSEHVYLFFVVSAIERKAARTPKLTSKVPPELISRFRARNRFDIVIVSSTPGRHGT